jgi:hypothetical protein
MRENIGTGSPPKPNCCLHIMSTDGLKLVASELRYSRNKVTMLTGFEYIRVYGSVDSCKSWRRAVRKEPNVLEEQLGACSCWFLAWLIFDSENGGNIFVRNCGILRSITALQPRIPHYSYLPLREPQIQHLWDFPMMFSVAGILIDLDVHLVQTSCRSTFALRTRLPHILCRQLYGKEVTCKFEFPTDVWIRKYVEDGIYQFCNNDVT